MTLEQLSYFYEVSKCLNFSVAAQHLFISQPNLTKYIANLEKELGFKLFNRSTHHCELTEEGQTFLNQTETIFHQLNHHIEDAKLRAKNPFDLITIGNAYCELPPKELMTLVKDKNRQSRLRYIMQEDNYVGLMNQLRSRKYDLIITTDKNTRQQEDFDFLSLQPFDMLLAIRKDHPLASRPDLIPADCEDEILFICIPEGKYAPINRIEEIHHNLGSRLNLSILDSPAEVLENTQIGAGVGIVTNIVDLARYEDLSYYRFGPYKNADQVLAWRKDEKRPHILSLIEEIRSLLPFDHTDPVTILGGHI